MFVVVVTFKIHKDQMDAFLPLMRQNASTSLEQEVGCLRFDVCIDKTRPNEVFLYELYKDAAAFDAHLYSPHFIAFDIETGGMIAEKTVKTYTKINP